MRSNSAVMSSESPPGSLSIYPALLSPVLAFRSAGQGLREGCAPACGRRPRPVAKGHTSGVTERGRVEADLPVRSAVAAGHASPVARARPVVLTKIIKCCESMSYKNSSPLPAFWPADCSSWWVVRQSSVRITPTPNAVMEAGTYERDIQSNVRRKVAADECLVLRAIPGADRTRTGSQNTGRPAAGMQAGPWPAFQGEAGRLTDLWRPRGSVLVDGTWTVGNWNGSLDRKESTRD